MTQFASVLITIVVLGAFCTGHSIAAQQDPDLEAESAATAETSRTATAAGDSTEQEQTRTETGAEQLSDQWSSEMGVVVMTRADVDTSKIVKGWHAHVVFTTDEKESAVTGVITGLDSGGVTVEYTLPVRRRGFTRRKRLRIAFEDIEVVAIAENREAVEAWPKTGLAEGLETRKRPWCEIGANLLSVFILKGESEEVLKMVNAGGGLSRLSPSFYMSSFFTERLAFDFGLAYSYASLGAGSGNSRRVAQGGFSLLGRGSASSSPYARVFATTLDGDYFDSQFGAGVGVGTRHVLRNTIALRYEVQYVRWFGDEFDSANQIEFLLNVGAVLGGR